MSSFEFSSWQAVLSCTNILEMHSKTAIFGPRVMTGHSLWRMAVSLWTMVNTIMCGRVNYIVYEASVFVWPKSVDADRLRERMSALSRMTVGGHLYMCVVRLVGILAYSDTGPRSCSRLVTSDESRDMVDRWTCRREPWSSCTYLQDTLQRRQ